MGVLSAIALTPLRDGKISKDAWIFNVDAAAIALLCLALLAALHRRPATAGGILAAATLIKPFAVVVSPALWRKWDWRMPAAFAATVAACYVPYLGAGRQALGFLGSYGTEEGYWDGKGFFLVDLLRHLGVPFPPGVAPLALASVLAGIGVFVALRPSRHPGDSWNPLLLGTAFLVLVSPHFAWYFAWVLPLLTRRLYVPLLFLTLG
jgi:alpha-1,6-mannosyltransferase